MQKKAILAKVKEIYDKGENMMQYLRGEKEENSTEDIMISYDFQAGSYTKNYYASNETYDFCMAFVNYISKLGSIDSIFEVGVGEANKLVTIINIIDRKFRFVGGADLSWSRVKAAQEFAATELKEKQNLNLIVGDMANLPLTENSIDLVYTVHALEPNRGREKELLMELYRVTKKWLVLVEPAYELANENQKKRMDEHGYVKGLKETAENLGYKIILYERFTVEINVMNPPAIMIIEKNQNWDSQFSTTPLCCPVTKKEVRLVRNAYYSNESYLAYPIIDGVPLLTQDNAVVATKMRNYAEK